MLLKDYILKLNKKFLKVEFNGISFNSKNIKKNYIYFAIKGSNYNGNQLEDFQRKDLLTFIQKQIIKPLSI